MSKHVSRFGFRPLALLTLGFCALLAPLGVRADDTTLLIPPNVQSSVDRGLAWLAQQQNANNGSWPAGQLQRNTAIDSLAIMAFLARGHTPGQGPYGDLLNQAVDSVLAQQKPSGILSANSGQHFMYDHGISTVMLCEVYGMVDEGRQKKIETALAKAVQVILDAQQIPKPNEYRGGWRYHPTSADSDISVSGWQLMALRGAANVGAAVPSKALSEGIAYIRHRAVAEGGFAYIGIAEPNPARTGTGIVSLELLGQHHSREALAGGDYLLRNPVRAGQADFYWYAVYYCSQASHQLGGKYWDGIYTPLRDSLVASQRANGSWAVSGSEGQAGDAYATSMALLALSVPYRYLPLYQR